MHWNQHTIFDNSLAAPEDILRHSGNFGYVPPCLRPYSLPAFLGDVRAFAIKKSTMIIRGIDIHKEPTDTFTSYQHVNLRAAFVVQIHIQFIQ